MVVETGRQMKKMERERERGGDKQRLKKGSHILPHHQILIYERYKIRAADLRAHTYIYVHYNILVYTFISK